MEADDSIFNFPCEFPIKAMGMAVDEFDCLVVGLVRKHCPNLAEGAVQTRLSNGGKYMSVTVTVNAESREHLDRIYYELTAEDRVLYAL